MVISAIISASNQLNTMSCHINTQEELSDEDLLMDEENKDPERLPALSPQERILLLELVNGHKGQVESKKSDIGSIKSKQTAWKKLSASFCSTPGTTRRSDKQLKKAWENLKRKSKKEVSFCRYK